jgi:hypothetical protein
MMALDVNSVKQPVFSFIAFLVGYENPYVAMGLLDFPL